MRRGLLGAGTVLFLGTVLGAALGYGFFVVAGHGLDAEDLGAVGSLVNLSTIVSVPALGLQLSIARAVATGARPHGLLLDALVMAAVPTLALTLLAPVLDGWLHLGSSTPVLALAACVPALCVIAAVTGAAQGRESFTLVAVLALLTGVGKLASGVIGVRLHQGVTGVMVWFAAAYWALALVALMLHPRRTAAGRTSRASLRVRMASAWAASAPTAGLLVLSSLDLLLARHHLSPTDSGAYTVGALFEKIAYWGPQFIATMAFAAMARPDQRRSALRWAMALTGAAGLVAVLLTGVAAPVLVDLAGGHDYAHLAGAAAWFTTLGALLALVQVLVYADIAAGRQRSTWLVWAGCLVCGVVADHALATTAGVVETMVGCVGGLFLLLAGLMALRVRGV